MRRRRAPAHSDDRGARVLLVDDDRLSLAMVSDVLRAGGYTVDCAETGTAALRQLDAQAVDVVVSDVVMPEMDGIRLLRVLRSRDPDLPVIMLSSSPRPRDTFEAARNAVEGFLRKPVVEPELLGAVSRAVTRRRGAQRERAWRDADAEVVALLDLALPISRLHFQPIVAWSTRRAVAWEALLRLGAPPICSPLELLAAAEAVDRVGEVGRRVRTLAANAVRALPADADLYVNLHPHELYDDGLYDRSAPLSSVAHRVVLELTERESLVALADLGARAQRLRAMGFRVALDDFGAGYASLDVLLRLAPDVVKIDRTLVRQVDVDLDRGRMVRSVLQFCALMKARVVCEGVEEEGEAHALAAMGVELMQGWYFGHPAPALGDDGP